MEMQLIYFKSLALWTTKFSELSKELETTAVHNQGSEIFTCWTSLPEKFCCLKRVALALLTVFGLQSLGYSLWDEQCALSLSQLHECDLR